MSKSQAQPTTPAVDAISEINLSGNTTPRIWYACADLKYPSGKTYLTAITLLSDICYWYTRSEEEEERSGRVIGHYRKFRGLMLEKDYDDWGAQFGLSRRETRDAVTHLVNAGLIARKVERPSNRVFLEPVPERILQITFPDGHRLPLKRKAAYVETEAGSRQKVVPPTLKRERTLTSSTTSTSHKKQQTTDVAASPVVEADKSSLKNDTEINALAIALCAAGYKPLGSARVAAVTSPELSRAWLQDIKGKKGLTNPGGYLRRRIAAGEFPDDYQATEETAPTVIAPELKAAADEVWAALSKAQRAEFVKDFTDGWLQDFKDTAYNPKNPAHLEYRMKELTSPQTLEWLEGLGK